VAPGVLGLWPIVRELLLSSLLPRTILPGAQARRRERLLPVSLDHPQFVFRIFACLSGFEDGFCPPIVFAFYVFQLFIRQALQPHKRIIRFADANEFVQLHLNRGGVTVCEFWIRNTIRNVTMVVPVLIILVPPARQSQTWLSVPEIGTGRSTLALASTRTPPWLIRETLLAPALRRSMVSVTRSECTTPCCCNVVVSSHTSRLLLRPVVNLNENHPYQAQPSCRAASLSR
jgi:hypothetical protein